MDQVKILVVDLDNEVSNRLVDAVKTYCKSFDIEHPEFVYDSNQISNPEYEHVFIRSEKHPINIFPLPFLLNAIYVNEVDGVLSFEDVINLEVSEILEHKNLLFEEKPEDSLKDVLLVVNGIKTFKNIKPLMVKKLNQITKLIKEAIVYAESN